MYIIADGNPLFIHLHRHADLGMQRRCQGDHSKKNQPFQQ
jgi:hypothetical protein